MREPVAFLITWTCYGTWLHGDDRGSVDREHRTPGTAMLKPSPYRRLAAARRMVGKGVRLDTAARRLVTRIITEHCERRDWELLACNVRTNHVHVVVVNPDVRPETIMGQLKAWTSRRLREGGHLKAGSHVWTRGGSTRYIWERRSIAPAVDYVLEGQDVRR